MSDLKNSNLYLFNMLLRHQCYLEGLKASFAAQFRRTLTELYGEFAKFIGQARVDNLDEFSRVELQHFIGRFQQAQTAAYSQYTQRLIETLKEFMAADIAVTKGIYDALDNDPAAVDEAALWASILAAIVPATGLTLNEMLNNFAIALSSKVSNRISIGYANGESVRDMFKAIIGSSDVAHRDGLFALFANQNKAILATLLQHVSALTQDSIAEQFYEQDQWVSILDNKTTVICRDRNGNIYPSGEGPYPPAHWFCRSKRVPLTQGDALHDVPDTFFDWAITQPESFLIDALGAALAAQFLAGNNRAKEISINELAIPLTVIQFREKLNFITV